MRENITVLELDKYERSIVVNALNDKRNELIKNQEDTEVIDDLLLKTIETPEKKERL